MFIALFSIFFITALGYTAKKSGLMEQKHASVFINFVLCFAIPALIFDKIYHVNIDTALLNIIMLGFAGTLTGALVALVLCVALKFSKTTTASAVLLSLFGNTLFVGVPVTQGFFGDGVLNEVIFYDQLTTSVPISILGPLILSFGAKERVSLLQNSLQILKFPPFIALLAGLIAKNFSLPEAIFTPLLMLEGAVTPVALFAIGLGLNFGTIKSAYKSTLVVLFCKMIVPALVFFAVAHVANITIDTHWAVGLFEACMPPMVLASAMIMRAELDNSLAISAVAMGVVASFGLFPLLFFLVGGI